MNNCLNVITPVACTGEITSNEATTFNPAYPNGYSYHMGPVGCNNPYGIPVNNGMPQLPPGVAADLYVKSKLSEQEAMERAALENLKHVHEIDKIRAKAYCDERRDEGMRQRKLMIDNATLHVCLDTNKCLCLVTELPDGKKIVGGSLFHERNMRVTRYHSAKNGTVMAYGCHWDGIENEIVLNPRDFTPKRLMSYLAKAGNPINIGKNHRSSVAELVFGYLCDTAVDVFLPEHSGWNKIEGTWKFVELEDGYILKLLKSEE